MRIIRNLYENDIDNVKRVELDENDEFVEIDRREYAIYMSSSEYRNIIPDILEEHVAKAIVRGLDVYFAHSTCSKFMLCGLDIASSQEAIIVFETPNTSKFELLDTCVKGFVKAIKEANKEVEE